MEYDNQNVLRVDNILIFKEKPYYSDEELELYYRIAIDEFQKNGYEKEAEHYRILLRMLLNNEKERDPLTKKILEHNNRNATHRQSVANPCEEGGIIDFARK